MEISGRTVNTNGDVVDSTGWHYAIRAKDEEHAQTLAQGLLYRNQITVKRPGFYRIGVAVRDEHVAVTLGHASGDGKVVYCGWNYADGSDPAWIVVIAHSASLSTWYAHMLPRHPNGIRSGSHVRAGQIIGYEGNTGHSTGAHLHWAVMYRGSFTNPRLFL